MDKSYVPADYLPILVQSVVALGFVAVTMILTHFMAERGKRSRCSARRRILNAGSR